MDSAIINSSTAVYYGGRHRFYTGDLTQSFPTYKEHQRAWTLKDYDNFGTHASTTVEGNKLKLANQGSTTTPSYVSGYWFSDPWDLSSITNVEGSFIEYCACARNGADVLVKAAVTTSTSTEPTSGQFTIATTTTTIPGITAGDNLYGKFLWLKIEMEPNDNATGTPCLCRINLAINNVGTTTSASNALQNISYTYDAIGNITQVKDLSGFGGDKTVQYTYDDLYRLLTASTTVPTNGGYNQTFTYDRIGNLLTGPSGTYTYGETGYTNPHGATQVGSSALTYDNNGNVTGQGSNVFNWNYRDRLTKSIVGGVNTFYGYDFNNDRVTKGNGTATTTYPNKYFNQKSATTTKHVFDNNGVLLATIQGDGSATSTHFIHGDHLNSTTVTVDEDGDVVSSKDYLPFGSEGVSTGEPVARTYIGEYGDTETNLQYLNARYMDPSRGQFNSQDPTFLAIGTSELADRMHVPEFEDKEKRNKEALQMFLSDPQVQNSYNYARNNPITLKDGTGEFVFLGPAAGAIITGAFKATVSALTFIKAAEVGTLSYYDLKYGITENRNEIKSGLVELGLGPVARGLGALSGTAKEIKQINALITTLEATEIIQAAPSAVRETYTNIRNYVQNFFNNNNVQTYTTPSGAVVNSSGKLISGPSDKKNE